MIPVILTPSQITLVLFCLNLLWWVKADDIKKELYAALDYGKL